MSIGPLLRYAHLAWFSRPSADRRIYRAVGRRRPQRIVSIGLHDVQRTRRLLELADARVDSGPVRFTGIDPFEARGPDEERLSLKDAFRVLRSSAAQVRLLPGEPSMALGALANALGRTDLLLIERWEDEAWGEAWFYVPRMLHDGSIVLRREEREGGRVRWTPLPRHEIDRRAGLAATHLRGRAAA